MAKKDTSEEVNKSDVTVNSDPENTVVQHLDKDPNDPRNYPRAKAGPSLNDPSWQEKTEG